MNPLAGLLPHSHNGKAHPMSERDAYMQIYGDRPVRHHPVHVNRAAGNGQKRPRDSRGRFLPASAGQRVSS
jgi:hypothetical protein